MKNISPLCTLVAIACFTNMATAMDWQVGGSHVRISNNGIQISYSGQSDGIVEISDRGIRIGQANANTAEQCTNTDGRAAQVDPSAPPAALFTHRDDDVGLGNDVRASAPPADSLNLDDESDQGNTQRWEETASDTEPPSPTEFFNVDDESDDESWSRNEDLNVTNLSNQLHIGRRNLMYNGALPCKEITEIVALVLALALLGITVSM